MISDSIILTEDSVLVAFDINMLSSMDVLVILKF